MANGTKETYLLKIDFGDGHSPREVPDVQQIIEPVSIQILMFRECINAHKLIGDYFMPHQAKQGRWNVYIADPMTELLPPNRRGKVRYVIGDGNS